MSTDDSTEPREPRRLTRSREARLITGVCGGLGRFTGIDPLVYRAAFAILVLAAGIGLPLYIGAALLMGEPNGGPSVIERKTHRLLDGDTALTLIGAGLAAGMVLGVAWSWGSSNALAVVVVFALALYVARSRGVDLVQTARTLPERLKGRPLETWTPPTPAYLTTPEGMVDLARLSTPEYTPPPPPYVSAPTAYEPQPPAYEPRPPKRRRKSSPLVKVTLLVTLVTGGILLDSTDGRAPLDRWQTTLAGMLVVVGVGLLLGSWFGRDRKLMGVGVMLALALVGTSVTERGRSGEVVWRPATTTQAERQSHKVFAGTGTVDLRSVALTPGSRLHVDADVLFGRLVVTVPASARIELHGKVLLGDITVDRRITSGPRARVDTVLAPETPVTANPATIELTLNTKIGDMEISRG